MTTEYHKARTVEITENHTGQRLDNYLMGQMKGVPKSHVYRLLRSGQVRVNSGRKKAHYKLKTGDNVRIPPVRSLISNETMIPPSVLQQLDRCKLYEDDDVLVLNKPSGLAVHSGSGIAFGVIEALKSQRPDQFIELVHRLDRETSGCLVLAKNRSSLTRLHEALRNEHAELGKYYLALVMGHWPGTITVDKPLKKTLRSGEHMVEVHPEGQRAVSHFKVIQQFSECCLVSVKIDTGRTHQIRVHAASEGCPVAGDSKYGKTASNREMKKRGLKRLFLHATRLELTLDAPIIIEAPLDSELQNLLETLKT